MKQKIIGIEINWVTEKLEWFLIKLFFINFFLKLWIIVHPGELWSVLSLLPFCSLCQLARLFGQGWHFQREATSLTTSWKGQEAGDTIMGQRREAEDGRQWSTWGKVWTERTHQGVAVSEGFGLFQQIMQVALNELMLNVLYNLILGFPL